MARFGFNFARILSVLSTVFVPSMYIYRTVWPASVLILLEFYQYSVLYLHQVRTSTVQYGALVLIFEFYQYSSLYLYQLGIYTVQYSTLFLILLEFYQYSVTLLQFYYSCSTQYYTEENRGDRVVP